MVKHADKYKTWPRFVAYYLYREWLRARLKALVSWKKDVRLGEGCTVVLGLCSRLPHVLGANLEGLERGRWPELKEVVIVVDSKEGVLEPGFAESILRRHPKMNIRFVYYSEKQHRVADYFKLPYVYAWLSWAIGMNESKTRVVLIHDYDAIVLSDILEKRYHRFLGSGAVMQGVMWYWTNGIVAEDRIATTFEAFVDLEWAKKFHPIQQINKVGMLGGRRVDYDILTEMQARWTRPEQRGVYPMGPEDLVHPTQMIHQYTMFRKFPSKPWYCASLLMIPFFYHRSGRFSILKEVVVRIRASRDKTIDLLGDGVLINFEWLRPLDVDQMLSQMVQVCVKMGTTPFGELIEYGDAFYDLTGVSGPERWKNSFSSAHLDWIRRARA